jgi:hypothetical protein
LPVLKTFAAVVDVVTNNIRALKYDYLWAHGTSPPLLALSPTTSGIIYGHMEHAYKRIALLHYRH